MKISHLGIDLIKHFEGLHDGNLTEIGLQPKLCPAGVWTCGYGHAIVDPLTHEFVMNTKADDGKKRALELYPTMTIEQAEKLLQSDLDKYERIVNNRITIELEQHEFDALVSHTFNTGGSTTLFNMVNKQDLQGINKWWIGKYVTANGKSLKGLKIRRMSEYWLFLSGELIYDWKV